MTLCQAKCWEQFHASFLRFWSIKYRAIFKKKAISMRIFHTQAFPESNKQAKMREARVQIISINSSIIYTTHTLGM
jgi:hypothetical protein